MNEEIQKWIAIISISIVVIIVLFLLLSGFDLGDFQIHKGIILN